MASADGLRFVVPVRTVNAGPNSKYFGTGRGITYYNFTSDQFTGFHGIVIPGTLRDSLFILEGLLEQQTSLRPWKSWPIRRGPVTWSSACSGCWATSSAPGWPTSARPDFCGMDPAADYGVLNGLCGTG